MFNKIVLVGHLTRDIELRYTQGSVAIGSCGIAVTRKYTLNGEKREETCFVDLTFFGKQAEIANQYLGKGSKLLVDRGAFKTRAMARQQRAKSLKTLYRR